jgi:hypothetical protein
MEVFMSSRQKKDTVVEKGLLIEPFIHYIRGQKVILDVDLARIYGVTTKRFNEQIKRNQKRFPDNDFIFQLTDEEYFVLRSQFATSKAGSGGRRYLPYVFTEYGAIMAANVLNSPSAVKMSVFVVRAFLHMRTVLSRSKDLARELAQLEKKLTGRLDAHEVAIVDILRRMMELLEPPPDVPVPAKRPIGFHAIP